MYIHIYNYELEELTSIKIKNEDSYIYELCKDFAENKYSILDELEQMDIYVDESTSEVFCTEDKLVINNITI